MAKILTGRYGSKKETILREAARLFMSKSYGATSMRELAGAVGVEAPSLYNHIGSKSELLREICFRVGNRFIAGMETISDGAGTPMEKIEQLIRFHIGLMLDEFEEVYVSNHEWKHLPPAPLANFRAMRRRYERNLASLVEQGIACRELKDINPHVAVLTILSALRGIEWWQRDKRNVSQHVLADGMAKYLLQGIAANTAGQGDAC